MTNLPAAEKTPVLSRERWLPALGGVLSAGLFVAAFFVLDREMRAHSYREVTGFLSGIPAGRLALAALLTALNYLALTGYDALALRYIRRPLGYGRTALVSFISYVFSYNVGLSIFGGGAVRLRMYSAWGLSVEEIGKIVGFCALTLWLGVFGLGGLAFLLEPGSSSVLPPAALRLIGVLFLALAAGYLAWAKFGSRPLRMFRWEFAVPEFRLAAAQTLLACADWMLGGLVLYVLLPASLHLSYPRFMAVFVLAQLSGLISHVPGGLGVFEMVTLVSLRPFAPASALLGALIAFRAVYYLLPLFCAMLLLSAHELLRRREGLRRAASFLDRWVWGLVPHIFTVLVFLAGAVLLFSGATPAAPARLAWLSRILPLSVVETSHFLGSVAGTLLLFLAWGLRKRLDAAYGTTVVLLIAGIFFSLLKGVDFEEAVILAAVLGSLLTCRKYFYRKTSFVDERFSPGWLALIVLVLGTSFWLGFFAFRHVEYSDSLWWRFGFTREAPRFLRAAVGSGMTALLVSVFYLLRPARPERAASGREEFLKAAALTEERAASVNANLALLGDKLFLFSESGKSFLMYGVAGRSWVALGEGVGEEEERPELAWRFGELCDRHGGWPVFYEVPKDHVYLYVDLGLSLLKLGEEARVPLQDFTLEGGANKDLRYAISRLEREGCSFEVAPRGEVPGLLPELRSVSDDWLKGKNTREKGFSLGFFDEEYLSHFPAALVRKGGRVIAFANLWTVPGKEELSADLMRHSDEAPPGIMDYLFAKLMLWGQEQGYARFSLGMAPLSGLENRALAPLWNKLGAFLYLHGEHFYNFQGLREYKEKFRPEWSPKYIASPGGIALPMVLTNVAALISGGIRGVVAK